MERLEAESEFEMESDSGETYYPQPKDDIESSALMAAAQLGRVDDVKRLIQMKDLEEKDSEGDTALMWALLYHRDEIFTLLVEAGASLLTLDPDRVSLDRALMTCCKYGSIPAIRACLDRGANVNYVQPGTGLTPLIHVVKSYGAIAVAEFLISRGADATAVDATGWNAILWAVHSRGEEVQWVQTLLSRIPGMTPKKNAAIKIQALWRGYRSRSCELGAWKPRGGMMFTFVHQQVHVQIQNDWFMSRMMAVM